MSQIEHWLLTSLLAIGHIVALASLWILMVHRREIARFFRELIKHTRREEIIELSIFEMRIEDQGKKFILSDKDGKKYKVTLF